MLTSVPAWYRAAAMIRNRIERRAYPPGATIPPEMELAQEFDVSRTTIRRSLNELVRGGYLERRQGVGTFVKPHSRGPGVCSGYLEDLLTLFTGTDLKRLTRRELKADKDIAEALAIAPGTRIVEFTRVRLLDGAPYNVARNYLQTSISQLFDAEELRSLRLLELLQKAGCRLSEASESITAVGATRKLAADLALPENAPLLKVRLVYYDDNTRPLAATDLFFPGHLYAHQIRLVSRI